MRAALLSMLAGCSFFVPPRAWHPTPDVDGWSCEARPFPMVDASFGGALLTTGIVLDVHAQNGGSIFEAVTAAYLAIASVPWIAGAIYGGIRSSSCSDEIARHNTTHFRRT